MAAAAKAHSKGVRPLGRPTGKRVYPLRLPLRYGSAVSVGLASSIPASGHASTWPQTALEPSPVTSTRCHVFEEDADVAAVRSLSPVVQSIGHYGAYESQGPVEAIRCRNHALAGTENFAPASFRAGPHGDFRIHIGYLAAASSAATGPWSHHLSQPCVAVARRAC